jgi:hypothetical protein
MKIGLPKFSERVLHALENGEIIKEIDKTIEETAYHILRCGDFKTKSDYAAYGRMMYDKYPCINFQSRMGDSSPCVSFSIAPLNKHLRNGG